jgi:hypothetical protein
MKQFLPGMPWHVAVEILLVEKPVSTLFAFVGSIRTPDMISCVMSAIDRQYIEESEQLREVLHEVTSSMKCLPTLITVQSIVDWLF